MLIDEYIKNAPAFARPVCRKLRKLIHKANREISERWKWGPLFCRNGPVCGLGVFQQHVSLAFFKGAIMKDPKGILMPAGSNVHSRLLRFTSLEEIDEPTIIAYVKEAVAINKSGIKLAGRLKTLIIPTDLQVALSANSVAQENFNNSDHTCRQEYVNWVEKARRPETRHRRITEVVRRSLLNQTLGGKKMNER